MPHGSRGRPVVHDPAATASRGFCHHPRRPARCLPVAVTGATAAVVAAGKTGWARAAAGATLPVWPTAAGGSAAWLDGWRVVAHPASDASARATGRGPVSDLVRPDSGRLSFRADPCRGGGWNEDDLFGNWSARSVARSAGRMCFDRSPRGGCCRTSPCRAVARLRRSVPVVLVKWGASESGHD